MPPAAPTAQRLRSPLAICAAALLFLWPAFFNRFPFFINDSIEYLTTGETILHRLSLHQPLPDTFRSELFSVTLVALHQGRSAWPVIVFNALLAATILFLITRSILGGTPHLRFLLLAALLAAFTTLPWCICLLTADIYGPVAYLSLFLLIFCNDRLHRGERIALACFIPWGIAAHMTHGILALGLWLLLAVLWLIRTPRPLQRGRALVLTGSLILLAGAAQVATHWVLYGKPSLNANALPYLTARILGDGTGRTFLTTHCPAEPWALCQYRDHLPTNENQFMAGPHNIWDSADTATRSQLRREQLPFVAAVIRAYPRRQAGISFNNAWAEFRAYDLPFLAPNLLAHNAVPTLLTHTGSAYDNGRQWQNQLPRTAFASLHKLVVKASLLALPILLVLAWRRRQHTLLHLAVVAAFAAFANPTITGVLSGLDSRYQFRIIWLLPMLAILTIQSLRTNTNGDPKGPPL